MKKFKIKKSIYFNKWIENLKNRQAKVLIIKRLERLIFGNFGDFKSIDKDISELRFFIGAGYRIYYTIKGNEIILLLNGGDKSSQSKDIQKAKEILEEYNNEKINNE